jgi:hypothetical protein
MRSAAVKLVLSAAGIALLMATPAEAAKSRKHNTQVSAKHTVSKQKAKRPAVAPSSSNDVFFQGYYLGSDPDPRIRFEIGRDLGLFFGGDD